MTGRVANGQVQLFATTGFGTGDQPIPDQSLIEVTDTLPPRPGMPVSTTLAADSGPSELTGVAFTPTQTVSSNAQVISVTNPGTQNNAVGDTTVSLPIQASGLPTGASWTYSASGLPSGLSISPTSGLITGTITGTAKTYTPTVTASDGQGGIASQSFTWNVSVLSVTNPGTQIYVKGSTVSLPVQASGLPTGDSWTYSATGLPCRPRRSTQRARALITGTITGADKTYTPTVTASDGQGGSASQSFTFYVVGPGVTVIGSQLYIVDGSTSNDQIQINAAGSSNTGSTGIQVQTSLNGVNTQTTYRQVFTTINIFLQGGNDNIQLASSLTINTVAHRLSNGNDNVHLGNGNNIVTLGNGNDNVQAGNGNNVVTLEQWQRQHPGRQRQQHGGGSQRQR